MRKFWSYISNGKYSIGTTGQTVYVFDENGQEKAKFKDLIYAYDAAISPNGDKFVIKTTDGRLGIYSFEPLRLIKKFRFSKEDGAQDEEYCFSPDGKFFYNIEIHRGDSYIDEGFLTYKNNWCVSIYNTDDFSLHKRLFEELDMSFTAIEFGKQSDEIFILGGRDYTNNKCFVAKISDEKLTDIKYISEQTRNFYFGFSDLKNHGFTEKAVQWSPLRYDGFSHDEIAALKDKDYSLENLWKETE